MNSVYRVTKTFGHELGLSACFRQHRAQSHCKFMHGYALSFTFTFETEKLDANGWVVDFGSFAQIKDYLRNKFDHKTLIAKDDPHLLMFETMHKLGMIELVTVERIGCESFAKMAYDVCSIWLQNIICGRLVKLISCEVREHGANSAIYYGSGGANETPQQPLT